MRLSSVVVTASNHHGFLDVWAGRRSMLKPSLCAQVHQDYQKDFPKELFKVMIYALK